MAERSTTDAKTDAKTDPGNPFALLIQDHREAEDLMEQLESAEGDERQELAEQLVAALALHMELEETLVYPVVQELLGDEPAEEARTEHQLARQGIDELQRLLPDEPGFGAALAMVQAGIEHHVEEEENEVFPQLRKKMDAARAEDLGRRLAEAKGSGADPGADGAADLEDLTKAELVDKAKEAGISGTSSMTKADLVEALTSGSR